MKLFSTIQNSLCQMSDDLMTVSQFAEATQLKRATIRKAVREGRLPAAVLNPGAQKPRYVINVPKLKDQYTDLMK